MPISYTDKTYICRAVELAQAAGAGGNLPIGAVITLGDRIIAEGANAIFSPELSAGRHAEMEALSTIPVDLRARGPEMTLYSTLEPCLMCLSAILLHRIGRVIYGSADPYGGGGMAAENLPPFFSEQFAETDWIGPAFSAACDPLYAQVKMLEGIK
jgi:tRNA(adenine34) deaminase